MTKPGEGSREERPAAWAVSADRPIASMVTSAGKGPEGDFERAKLWVILLVLVVLFFLFFGIFILFGVFGLILLPPP